MSDTQSYESGAVIWRQGDRARPLHLVSGVAAYVVTEGSERAFLGLFGPSQDVLPDPVEPGRWVAATDLIAVTAITTAHPDSWRTEASVRAVLTAAREAALYLLPQRAARQLLRLSELLGTPDVRVKQELLALLAGGRRETLAAIYSEWRENVECIDTRYRRVIVKDREKLARIAGL